VEHHNIALKWPVLSDLLFKCKLFHWVNGFSGCVCASLDCYLYIVVRCCTVLEAKFKGISCKMYAYIMESYARDSAVF